MCAISLVYLYSLVALLFACSLIMQLLKSTLFACTFLSPAFGVNWLWQLDIKLFFDLGVSFGHDAPMLSREPLVSCLYLPNY